MDVINATNFENRIFFQMDRARQILEFQIFRGAAANKEVLKPISFEFESVPGENVLCKVSELDLDLGMDFMKACARYLHDEGIPLDFQTEAEIEMEGLKKELSATKNHLSDLQILLNLHVDKESKLKIER